jgi:hypothetical protein
VAAPQAEYLDSIEINDQLVALPKTRLVLCTRTPAAAPLFFWTGFNVLAPRRPLSDRGSDSVEVRFDDTTPTLKTLTLQMYHRREQINVQWPDVSNTAGFASLTSPGPHRYVIAADVPAYGLEGRLFAADRIPLLTNGIGDVYDRSRGWLDTTTRTENDPCPTTHPSRSRW